MRKLIIRIIHPFLRVFVKYYFTKPRRYNYKKIKGVVIPKVFHPQLTISTKILLDYIDKEDLENKSLLELGCGSGIISTLAASKKAKVMASDINVQALENALLNADKNKVKIETVNSNLFQKIPQQEFDYIIINPPYYPKTPQNVEEKAWFCGGEFEYFKDLFSTLYAYFNNASEVIMILSEDCEIETIKEIALQNKIAFKQVLETKKWGEKNYLFQLERSEVPIG